ncbi:MAG: hypothetical protein ACFCUT_20350 [Kiloniellaceae bacterium]
MRALTAYNLLGLLVCGALGAWVYEEALQPLPPLPDAVPLIATIEIAAGPGAAPEPGLRMPPRNTFAQLATRPPFSPSRRPPRAKPAPVPVVQKQEQEAPRPVDEPQVTLVGIVINADKSIAMVRKTGVVELLRLGKGETLDGWLVEGVLPNRLVLSHGEKLLELELTEGAQGNGGASEAKGATRQRRQ